jgi:transcription initiation factor TFIIH subunit 3
MGHSSLSYVQKSVDFKASCHCHQRPVEFAYMCSVCLTLTCQPADLCEVCHTPARGAARPARAAEGAR